MRMSYVFTYTSVMVTMVLDGMIVDPKEFMGKVSGGSFTKDREDFFSLFPLEWGLVPPSPFGMISGVERVLFRISSPLYMCLL